VALDNRPADRQTDAHAVRLGRVERFEQFLDGRRIDACSGVAYLQPDGAIALEFRPHQEGSGPVFDAVHRVSRVEEQVQDDLLQLNAVGAHRWQAICEFCLQSRVAASDQLLSTLEAAFAAGGIQLVIVPVDYSENKRVLIDELTQRMAALQ
jgi:hypothetical protein